MEIGDFGTRKSELKDPNSVEADKIQKKSAPTKIAERKEYSGNNFS